MAIPTEPIGSIPRPPELLVGMQKAAAGEISDAELDGLHRQALRSTIAEFEATRSPVISDGEQRKPSFATYPIAGLETLAAGGVVIPFADGHTRELPVLTAGPFRYRTHAVSYLVAAQELATRPVKQAVISASALSLLYPTDGIDGYSRDAFLADLVDEAEADPEAVLEAVAENLRPAQRVFVGVTDPVNPAVETPEQVRDRVLLAAKHIPVAQLGTTDDCGFSPFADDSSTARETAFAKIRARVQGTELAAEQLGA
jgi:methionine synthase II (cobalamin-independent)